MAHERLVRSLHEKLAAILPTILGVSIGVEGDKETWLVHFKPGTTQAKKTLVANGITAFDSAAEEAILVAEDVRAKKILKLADILISKGIITEADLQ